MNTLHLLGAGSIGLLWACRLAEQGHAPVLITRHADADWRVIREENGTRMEFQFTTRSAPLQESIRFLFITTKAHQTRQAVTAIRAALRADAIIVLLQNGMGNAEWLAAQFPQARLYVGTTTDGVFRRSKTEISVAGQGETFFGAYDADSGTSQDHIRCLLQPSFRSRWDANITERLWQKLAINCVINPLAALYECRNGELISNPAYFHHFSRIAVETEKACAQLGVRLPPPNLLDVAAGVAKKTAQNINSMLADKRSGQGTEIDFILGYLLSKVEIADYPELASLYDHIKQWPLASS